MFKGHCEHEDDPPLKEPALKHLHDDKTTNFLSTSAGSFKYPSPSSTKTTTFAKILYGLVANSSEHAIYHKICRFSREGNAVYVLDKAKFEEEILPKYFRHGRMRSFTRQLNAYKFTIEGSRIHDEGTCEEKKILKFKHPEFHRDHPEAIDLIERRKLPTLDTGLKTPRPGPSKREQQPAAETKCKRQRRESLHISVISESPAAHKSSDLLGCLSVKVKVSESDETMMPASSSTLSCRSVSKVHDSEDELMEMASIVAHSISSEYLQFFDEALSKML